MSRASLKVSGQKGEERNDQAAQRAAGDVAAGQQHARAGFRLGLGRGHAPEPVGQPAQQAADEDRRRRS